MFLKGQSSLYSCPFSSERRVHESLFAWMVGLIDEVSIKRIHIEEKITGNFMPTESMIYHT